MLHFLIVIRSHSSIRFVSITDYFYTGYKLVYSGSTCDRITSLSECSDAAAALKLSDTIAKDDGISGHSSDPPYCYLEDNILKFNSDGTNTGKCSAKDTCICFEGRHISAVI